MSCFQGSFSRSFFRLSRTIIIGINTIMATPIITQSVADVVAIEFRKRMSKPKPPIKITLNKAVSPVILNIALIKSIMFGIFYLKTAKITPR